jgi:hypothetical protein
MSGGQQLHNRTANANFEGSTLRAEVALPLMLCQEVSHFKNKLSMQTLLSANFSILFLILLPVFQSI